MHATVFNISTEYRGSRITIRAERMPSEELWALQTRIAGELFAHERDDGDLWAIVPRLLDDAIAEVDRWDESDAASLDGPDASSQV